MLRFLDDADLIEHDRDELRKILFSASSRKSTCEFPFQVDQSNFFNVDDEAGCSLSRLDGHRSSDEKLNVVGNSASVASAYGSTTVRRQDVINAAGTNAHYFSPNVDSSPKKHDHQQLNGNAQPFINPGGSFSMTYPPVFPYGASSMPPNLIGPPFGTFSPGYFVVPYMQKGAPPIQHLVRSGAAAATTSPLYAPHNNMFFSHVPIGASRHPALYVPGPLDAGAPMAVYPPPDFQPLHISHIPSHNQNNIGPHSTNYIFMEHQEPTSSDAALADTENVSALRPASTGSDDTDGRRASESPIILSRLDDRNTRVASRTNASSSSRRPENENDATEEYSDDAAPYTDSKKDNIEASFTPSPPPPPPSTVNNENVFDSDPTKDVTPVAVGTKTVEELDETDGEKFSTQRRSPAVVVNQTETVEISGAADDGEEQSIITTTVADHDVSPATATATAPKPKTWASLFQNTRAASRAIVITSQMTASEDDEDGNLQRAVHESLRQAALNTGGDGSSLELSGETVSVDRDPKAMILANAFKTCELLNRGPTFALRGIVNRGNWCYVNASLQALMACPPFYHFLRSLETQVKRAPSSTPLLDAFVKLALEFPYVERSRNQQNRASQDSRSLDPVYLYNLISRFKTDAFKGRQEDAEEFLLLVFNNLHDEMVSCLSLLDKGSAENSSRNTPAVNGDVEEADNNEWQQVGPGRKAAVTRQTKYAQSPISQIFSGQLRYGLQQPGVKETANVEPFFTLPLDVQLSNVKDIATALQALSRDTVKVFGVKTKAETDATRRMVFVELPRVLIFQLKYFVYTDDGCVKKIMKPIEYPMDLSIDRDLVMRGKILGRSSYKLFAVVFHHGEKAEGGHYTVDIFHAGQWVHVDDTKITPVNNEHVLNQQTNRVPYLLFYRRLDALTSDQQQSSTSGGNAVQR